MSADTEMMTLRVFSSEGLEVYQSKGVCTKGQNQFDLARRALAPGMYFIKITDQTGEKSVENSCSKIK